MIPRLFLHYFDLHFLEEKGANLESRKVRKFIRSEVRFATRFAILTADEVFVPAASFVESDLCFEELKEFEALFQLGWLRLVGGGANLMVFAEEKLQQYAHRSLQHVKYTALKKRMQSHPPFYSRRFSASRDIAQGWLSALDDGRVAGLVKGTNEKLPRDFEKRWEGVNERLEGRAFVLDHVEPLLSRRGLSPVIRSRIHGIVNEEYFESFTRELCAGVVRELTFLEASYVVPSYGENLPYRDTLEAARKLGLLTRVGKADGLELANLRSDPRWQECLLGAKHDYERRMRVIARQVSMRSMIELADVSVGIITALPEEFAAACEVFDCSSPIDVYGRGSGRRYSLATIPSAFSGSRRVAVAMLTDMGNTSAATRATQMLFHCPRVEHIIMCGIAGAVPYPARPAEHVRLGDIVVSDRYGVVQYDFAKESLTQVTERHAPRPPGSGLIEAVRYLRAEEQTGKYRWVIHLERAIRELGSEWERPADDEDRLRDWSDEPAVDVVHPLDPERRAGRPRVFHGPIASANTLLKNPRRRDALREKFGVKAVEMEGAGVADATWNLDRAGYLVVRSTCDYCDPNKSDRWHRYAAIAAAAYSRAVVEMLAAEEN